MKILSIKKGFETDHSTSSYGYIDGIKLNYDYGKWVCEFSMLYNTKLFKELTNFDCKCMIITKKFNKIIVELTLYSEVIGEDEYEWATLINEIKEEVEKHNLEPLEVVEAYCTDEDKFESMKTVTAVGTKLHNCLTTP
jgi:hypothetical protein